MQNSPAAERKPHRGDLNLLVLPGEQVRKPYSWPLTNACPHCGSIGWFDKNELAGVGHCFACGTWVYREEPIPWQRESNARLVHRPPKRREIAATCQKCGKVKKQPPDLTAGEFNRSE